MKKLSLELTVSLCLLAGFTLSLSAQAADSDQGVGTWTGSGVTFTPDGKEEGPFTVELTRKSAGAGVVETTGEVKLGNGTKIPLKQRTESQGNTFSLKTNRGEGGGICVGAGLCQSYEQGSDGRAWSTTIVVDAPDKLRLIITELQNGRATRFIRQSITRTAQR